MNRGHFCFDIEGNGLLDNSTVDYTASPFKIKPHYNLHCIVATNMDTNESFEWVGKSIYTDFRLWVKENVNKIVGHNIINFDLLALTACLGMDYTLGFEGTSSTWDGKPVEIVDTFILSKTLWPDRPGHSLDYLGSLIGEPKIDWRAKAVELGLLDFHAPKGAEFATYHPEMLVYNRQDVKANIKVYDYLMKEWGSWKWENAFELEQYVAWVITRQQHRGFHYNKELASECVEELDLFMKERRERVEPHLPEKVMGKTKIKEFTPPKTQFLKSGKPSSHIEKWVEKHGGSIVEGSEGYVATVYGKDYLLPITTPVKTHEPASISDSTFIKEVLVGMGWKPSNFKEKDLTLDSKKKKLTKEKYEQTVDRYVEQTLNSNFKKFRLERLGVSESTFKSKLLAHDLKKPLKVLTNPTFTVGQEKEIDPALEEMESTFPYAKDIVEYLTFNHRRNSILGGGFDLEDEEDASTGFLPNVREDGRIPTPADSCGASTGRMKHRLVCNIPRVTSLYGEKIREQFGVGDGKEYVQFAFDFCSLEAMIESHYCWRYDNTQTKEYCNSLIQEKPNDVHTRTAAKISEMIDQAFSRGNSKAVKYCCVPMHTTALTRTGWKHYEDIVVGEEVLGYNPETGKKQWTKILNKFKKEDEVIEFGTAWFKVQATKDHRWYVLQRKEFSTGKVNHSVRQAVKEVRQTQNLNTESSIIVNAPFDTSFDTTSSTTNVMSGKYKIDWTKRVLEMSHTERVAFLEGFMIADGHHNGRKWQWAQKVGELYEGALVASYLVHDKVVQVSDLACETSKMKNVILSERGHRGLQTATYEKKGVQEVWCVETELGSWVMRQGDVITITGNCSYGGQGPKVAQTVGCTPALGQKIFEAFWEAASPLARLKEALIKYWETVGEKKFILGLDGRKIMTRSKHSLVNSLFQSAGVICAKRSMVYQDISFRENGYAVNFWLDDWRNSVYIQQLIAYHDEAQMEVKHGLFTYKKFENEEICKDWIKQQEEEWLVLHTNKGWFAASSPVIKICRESVEKTSKFYKLNVNLAIDPQLGLNWANCH